MSKIAMQELLRHLRTKGALMEKEQTPMQLRPLPATAAKTSGHHWVWLFKHAFWSRYACRLGLLTQHCLLSLNLPIGSI